MLEKGRNILIFVMDNSKIQLLDMFDEEAVRHST